MAPKRTYRVNDVAQIAGVSVRALHHWDEIGLLVPSRRAENGYRLYDDDDLLRLQQILIGRELGMPLEAIRRSLDDPSFDRKTALREQRAELSRRAEGATRMIRAIDQALAALEETVDLKEIFDGFDHEKHEAEAKERWGHTDAWKESQRRTKSYSKADWERLKEEQGAIHRDAFAALEAGKSPDDEAVMDVAERHRLSIDRWFYPCPRAMHANLADLYESDERFAANIDKFGRGLTPFLAAAIRANAKRST
jgi:MerR family transcriptional regulator, thiopeptide resistance regulator